MFVSYKFEFCVDQENKKQNFVNHEYSGGSDVMNVSEIKFTSQMFEFKS